MPIHTLFRGVPPRYPRLGVIRLGVTVVSDKLKDGKPITYPREVSYFVTPPDLARVAKIGDKPKAIEVSFPSDDPAYVFDLWYTRYDGPLLAAKCDGVTCTLIPKEGAETTTPCTRPERGPAKCPACGAGALGRLNVIVRHSPVLGVHQVLIGGESRCRSILTELKMYERAGLSRNWFLLERQEQEVQIRTEAGKRLSRTGWPVHILFHHSPDLILGPMTPHPALTAGEAEDEEDAISAETPDAATIVDDDLPEELRDDAPPDWSIEGCYRRVAELGIEPTVYANYLQGVYLTADALTAKALEEQRAMIEPALKDRAAADKWRGIVRDVAGKVGGRK